MAITIDRLPRTPDQVMTGSHGFFSLKSSRRTRLCTPNTITLRTRIMITKKATMSPASAHNSRNLISSPIRMKTKELAMKAANSQKEKTASRVVGLIPCLAPTLPTIIPQTTTAMTPEAWSCMAITLLP